MASVPIMKVQATTSAFNDTALIWHAQLMPVASVFDTSGNPFTYSLTVTGDDGLNATISDVIFGDVWVCSGQSNMAFLTEMAMNGQTLVEEACNHGAQVRLFTTRKLTATSPLLELGQDTNGGLWTRGVELPWSRASRKTISDDGAAPSTNDDDWLYMSAVCYLFGLEINRARGVPVGLINTNWGGTQIEDWMPQQAIDDCSHGTSDANGSLPEVVLAPRVATHLYNAMISPLLNQTIKGAMYVPCSQIVPSPLPPQSTSTPHT
jgi:sialate O-acetylesterase